MCLIIFLEFQLCSQPGSHDIFIGKNVSSTCRLHNTSDTANMLQVYFCPGGGQCEHKKIVSPNDLCVLNETFSQFKLLVSRPPQNTLLEANIHIYGVTGNTSLNVQCTAQYTNGIRMMDVSMNTLMIDFIMPRELSCH